MILIDMLNKDKRRYKLGAGFNNFCLEGISAIQFELTLKHHKSI
jgi:hypothetical protein